MKRFFVKIFSVSIGLVFIFSNVLSIKAQETDTEEFTLEEITVTAQKREENQQKVPIAMEVISGADLKEVGRSSIDEILNNISSVLIQNNTDGLRVSLRGVSNDNSPRSGVSTYTPSVAVNQDGIYTNRNQSNQNMYDIERVEVLYGPQATLYASASPGGIVNVVSADPKLDVIDGSAILEYGNYNHLRTEGSLNIPLNTKMALRGAFSQSKHTGYLTNGSNDEDVTSARLKALYQPNDKLSIKLTGEFSVTGGKGFASVDPFDDQDDLSNPWEATDAAGQGQDRTSKKIATHINWDADAVGTLTIIGSYLRTTSSSAATSTQGDAIYDSEGHNKGFEKGVEARMTSSEDFPFKWIVGGNIYRSEDGNTSSQVNVDLSTDWQNTSFKDIEKMKAIYVDITYPFTDRFRVNAGARKTHHTDGSKDVRNMPSRDEVHEGTMTYTKPIYKLGLEYDLAQNSMLYTNWSSSYRMNGAMNPGSPPEQLYAYEAGAKNRFLDNKLQLNVSGYYYDYQNYFANGPRFDPPYDSDGDGILDATYEVDGKRFGDATIYGFDVQTSTVITAVDKLDLSVSYVKKYFSNLYFDWPDVVNDYGIPDLDYSNMDMPQAPHWNVVANYSHNFLLGNGGSLKASLDVRYTTKTCLNWQAETLSLSFDTDDDGNYTGGYVATVEDTGNYRYQEAYHIENINVVYADPGGKWTLSGYVNNLENYAVKQMVDGDGNLMIGNPRTYGAVLSVKF